MGETCAGHLFADAAGLQKVSLNPVNELAQENVGLMNESNGEVGGHFGSAFIE